MIGTIIGIVLLLIVLGVVWWAMEELLPLIPLPETFRKIVRVLLVVLLALIVIWVIVLILNAAGIIVKFPGVAMR